MGDVAVPVRDAIKNGAIAIEIKATFHEMMKTTIPTPTIVKTCWKKKIKP